MMALRFVPQLISLTRNLDITSGKNLLTTKINYAFLHTRNYSRFVPRDQWKYVGYTFDMLSKHFEKQEKLQQKLKVKEDKGGKRKYKVQPHPSVKARRRTSYPKFSK